MTLAPFTDINQLRQSALAAPPLDTAVRARIATREATLTKPPGSLGELEALTAWLGAVQGRDTPKLDRIECLVFAGNHGVVAQGVSAWPAEVTGLMVSNFKNGGAAINQLARVAGAHLRVIAVEELRPTHDFTAHPAMNPATFLAAVNTGYAAIDPDLDLLALGEMGIGNTTSAAAIACALFGGAAQDWAGPGAGTNAAGLARKILAVSTGLARHTSRDALEILRCFGGHELAAIMGAVLAARTHGVPVLLDGFICTAAVAPLHALHASGLAHTRAAHCSAEPGHRRLLGILEKKPLLDLDLRLGEGSGAALAIPLLRAAVACHTGMATFDDLGIAV